MIKKGDEKRMSLYEMALWGIMIIVFSVIIYGLYLDKKGEK